MNPAARFAAWYFAPAPAERLASLRLLIGGFGVVYLIARAPALAPFTRLLPSSFTPIGVTRASPSRSAIASA